MGNSARKLNGEAGTVFQGLAGDSVKIGETKIRGGMTAFIPDGKVDTEGNIVAKLLSPKEFLKFEPETVSGERAKEVKDARRGREAKLISILDINTGENLFGIFKALNETFPNIRFRGRPPSTGTPDMWDADRYQIVFEPGGGDAGGALSIVDLHGGKPSLNEFAPVHIKAAEMYPGAPWSNTVWFPAGTRGWSPVPVRIDFDPRGNLTKISDNATEAQRAEIRKANGIPEGNERGMEARGATDIVQGPKLTAVPGDLTKTGGAIALATNSGFSGEGMTDGAIIRAMKGRHIYARARAEFQRRASLRKDNPDYIDRENPDGKAIVVDVAPNERGNAQFDRVIFVIDNFKQSVSVDQLTESAARAADAVGSGVGDTLSLALFRGGAGGTRTNTSPRQAIEGMRDGLKRVTPQNIKNFNLVFYDQGVEHSDPLLQQYIKDQNAILNGLS